MSLQAATARPAPGCAAWRPARRPLASRRSSLHVTAAAGSKASRQPGPAASSASTSAASTPVPSSVGSSAAKEGGSGKKKVLVVGGGWAGFATLKHLAEQGYDVTLLDASPNPGGLAGGRQVGLGVACKDRSTCACMRSRVLPCTPT